MSQNTAILLGAGAIAITVVGGSCATNASIADLRNVVTMRMDSFEERLSTLEGELRTQGTSLAELADAVPAAPPPRRRLRPRTTSTSPTSTPAT